MCPTTTSVTHFAGTTAEWHYGKQRLKRCVLRPLRKTVGEGADVTRCGKPFQTLAAATGKTRSPTVDSRVRRTIIKVTRRIVDVVRSSNALQLGIQPQVGHHHKQRWFSHLRTHGSTRTEVWYGIVEFNVPLDTV